ncbi:hypothetical protein PG988_005704 [Apiospora saccharicola]
MSALPPEVRQRIWEHYLAIVHGGFFESIRPMHTFFGHDELDQDIQNQNPPAAGGGGLFATYRELAPLVHESAVLRIQRPGSRNERRIGFAAKGTLRFERLRRLVFVVDSEEYAYWNSWLDFFGAVLGRAQGLEHLTIDWAPRTPAVYPPARGGWEARRDEKKEAEFLDMLGGLDRLQTLRFYGRAPEGWVERIRLMSGAQVKSYSFRWWREPGMDRY